MKYIVGIDPGFKGAIAFIDPQSRVSVHDLPLKLTESNTKQIDADAFSDILAPYLSLTRFVGIEKVHSMPKQGVASTFTFGFNTGIIHGVLSAYDFKILPVIPSVWKASLGLSNNKKDSILLARKLFPLDAHYFTKVSHDGRAEAALIGYFVKTGINIR